MLNAWLRTMPIVSALAILGGCTSTPERPGPLPTPTAEPVVARLWCNAPALEYGRSTGRRYRPLFRITVGNSGRPDFTKTWAAEAIHCGQVWRHSGPLNAVEQKAYDASGQKDIAAVYRTCAEVDPNSPYIAKDFTATAAEAAALRAALVLCPDHPQAQAWQRAIG